MVEVVYYVAQSLDGFIATDDGKVDWLEPYGTGEDHGWEAMWQSIDGLLMGRGTYDFALAHEPWMAPDKPSWVFTRSERPLAHPSVTLTPEAPEALLATLQERGHRRLWLVGGGRLAASFQQRGLITDYQLFLIPILLGRGIPLFGPFAARSTLRLVESRSHPSGIVQLRYVASREG